MSKDSPSTSDLQARIRQAGLRSTAARVAVLRLLDAAHSPVSHAELAEQLVPLGFDRATVYRNLMDLTECGLVGRTELGDHVWRFESRSGEHEHAIGHPHFMCVDCGKVQCLTEVDVSISPPPGSKRSQISELTEVLLKGRCARCA